MAIPSHHVGSHTGTCLSRYPMSHPNIDNTGCTKDEERAASWQEQMATKTWEVEQEHNQGDYRDRRTPPTKRDSNRPAPCASTND